MGSRRTKQIWLFLTPADEEAVAADLTTRLPTVRFVDEWRWEAADRPPVRQSPAQCDRMIGIWGSHLVESLTGVVRGNGTIDGPDTGAVVQWRRSDIVAGALHFGRWAVVYDSDDTDVAAYARALWRVIKDHTTNRLIRMSGDLSTDRTERRFWVGRDAEARARKGELSLVADSLVLAPEPGPA